MHENLAELKGQMQHHKFFNKNHKSTIIPLFSLISQLDSSLKSLLRSGQSSSWLYFILAQKRSWPSLANLVASWQEHAKRSLQCQLMMSMLRGTSYAKIQLYLRLKKYVLQLMNVELLDEITLKHEDAITIIHRMFKNVEFKKDVIGGIKKIFLSFKLKDPKIYACVFIEFLHSVYDARSFTQRQFFSAASNSQSIPQSTPNTSNFNSIIHKKNGLYRKNDPKNYCIIDSKFLPKKGKKSLNEYDSEFSYEFSNGIHQERDETVSNIKSIHESRNYSFFSKDISHLDHIKELGFEERGEESSAEDQRSVHIIQSSPQRNVLNCYNNMILIKQCEKSENDKENILTGVQRLMTEKNNQFKKKMLSSCLYQSREGSYQRGQVDENQLEPSDSIQETVNIIHHSIAKNRMKYQ